MRKALALVTVLLLLAAPWTLFTAAQEDHEAVFGPDLGAELAAYGRQYVENLVLYSGAGVDMVWAPAYDGNATKLVERISEIESWAGGTIPAKATPVVVPFEEADPGFAGEAPLNHSLLWSWNQSALDPTVDAVSVAKTVIAEVALADHLLSTGDANDSAEGALMLLAAVDAVRFVGEHLGYNGSSRMPYTSIDANHSDMNASNGWWLPVTEATGDINEVTGAWEQVTVTEEESLEAALWMLRAALAVNMSIYEQGDLEGAGKPLPADSGLLVSGLANALFSNLLALYYDAGTELFWDDAVISTGQLALLHATLLDVKGMGAQPGQDWSYRSGWAGYHAGIIAKELLALQKEDGTFMAGLDTGLGGAPESFIPPYAANIAPASLECHMMASIALYGAGYEGAARAAVAAMDGGFWQDDLWLVSASDSSVPQDVGLARQVMALEVYASAVGGGVELAKYRVAELAYGIGMAGFQLSETDATGENYTAAGNDTDMDGIPKHNMSRGEGRMYGVAPVLAAAVSYDNATGNFSMVDMGMVSSGALMHAAIAFMSMDVDWFVAAGEPAYGEEHAERVLLWSDAELAAWMAEREQELADLGAMIAELKSNISNVNATVAELLMNITYLEENLTAMEMDLNESRENVTVLNGTVKWLREKLEETNETVDGLNEEIAILEERIGRLEVDVKERDENVTQLESDLREARNNATKLQWELDNATIAMEEAQRQLDATEDDLANTEEDLDAVEGRFIAVAVGAFIAGLVVMFLIRWLMARK